MERDFEMMSVTKPGIPTGPRSNVGLLSILGTVLLAGCGNGEVLNPLSGKVTLDGAAVTKGTVTFTPIGVEGETATGEIGSDGRFSLSTRQPGDGVQPGQYKIAVTAWDVQPTMDADGKPVEGTPAVPEKYFSPETSGLEAVVLGDLDETVDLELKSD